MRRIDSFFDRQEWKELRYAVLRKYGFQCMGCSRGRIDGVVLHVDHIKPRSIYPELALVESNLQVLCADCNLGKSNKYEDDLRPKETLIKKRVLKMGEISQEMRRARAAKRLAEFLKKKLKAAEEAKDTAEQAKIFEAYMSLMRILKDDEFYSAVKEASA